MLHIFSLIPVQSAVDFAHVTKVLSLTLISSNHISLYCSVVIQYSIVLVSFHTYSGEVMVCCSFCYTVLLLLGGKVVENPGLVLLLQAFSHMLAVWCQKNQSWSSQVTSRIHKLNNNTYIQIYFPRKKDSTFQRSKIYFNLYPLQDAFLSMYTVLQSFLE